MERSPFLHVFPTLVLVASLGVVFSSQGCSKGTEGKEAGIRRAEDAQPESLVSGTGARVEKNVLFINSYHDGYPWSDGILEKAAEILANPAEEGFPAIKVVLDVIYMDTKRNTGTGFAESTAESALEFIRTNSPDLIITSDDNAAAYVIAPHLVDSGIPVVFTGVNWDASDYGFPASNITGMIEVQLIDQIVETLAPFARGNRVAFLKGDDSSARKEASWHEKRLRRGIDSRFVRDFEEWKDQYSRLQDEADILLLGNVAAINGWDKGAALAFIEENTRIPSGNWDEWMAPFSLVTFATQPEEQGEWAAITALRILSGVSPSEIPVVENHNAKVILNMPMAKSLGIIFDARLVRDAVLLDE